MALTAGAHLGPYEITAQIGVGGMGEVYKARDMRLNRTVAIKALPAHLKDNPDLRQRFEREAQAVAALSHPHICTLHDIGHHEGVDFLVMEYLEGETLADRLARKAGSKDPALPSQEVLRYAIEIAQALDHAHRKGITHRDLKPSNIMVTAAGAKVLDFGLAKVLARPVVQGFSPAIGSAAPTEEASLTAEGTILGTLQYMAPEQLEGKEADPRTDIFAFGAIVYEMATGRKAFEGKSQASLIAAILDHDPPALSTLRPLLPSALDHIVKTCLAKNPDERRQTMHDVLLELTWIAAGDARAEAAAPVTAARERLRARIALVGIGLAAGSVVAGVAVWNITRPSGPEPKPVVHLAIPLAPDAPLDVRFQLPSLALSPDGSRLVYTADRAGRRQLYVRPLDQREATPIPGTEGAFSPFFSPDGQWVGFSADGTLKKVPLAGGAPLTICDCDTGYGSWGPDDTIIFSSDRGLTQVSAAGGARRTVTTLDPKQHETGHLYPDILPGGQAVLFSVWTGGAWDDASIAVQRLDTGERRILGEKGTNARYAPSGHLLFARAGSLMAAPFDPSRLAVTGPAVPVVEGLIIHGPSGAAQFALSKDGRLVYATRAAGLAERTLVWVDRRGGVQPLTATRKAFALPRLSPDGQRVALLTEDNNSDIWIDEIARGTFTRLTFENNDFLPIWTPDGKRVTFSLHAGRAAEPVLDSGRRHRPGREAATERVCSHSPPPGHRTASTSPSWRFIPPTGGTSGYCRWQESASHGRSSARRLAKDGRNSRPMAAGSPTAPTSRAAGRPTCSRSRVLAGRCRFPPKAVPR